MKRVKSDTLEESSQIATVQPVECINGICLVVIHEYMGKLNRRDVLAKIYHVDDETMGSVENIHGSSPRFRFQHIFSACWKLREHSVK